MAISAGSVFVRVGADFDRKGFDAFERNVVKAQQVKDIEARLGASVDQRAFDTYQRKLEETRRKAKERDAYKATLGADFDSRAFSAYYRELDKARVASDRASQSTVNLGNSNRQASFQVAGMAGAFRKLYDTAAKVTILGVAAQSVSALGGAAAAAASGFAPLTGALAAYPALASTAGQGLGVFSLATQGITKVVGGLNDKLSDNQLAFRKLSPEAQKFALQLEKLKEPLRDLPGIAQQGLLPGLTEGIQDASKNLDVLRPIIRNTARELGDLTTKAGELVGSRGFGRDLATQGERNVRWIGLGGDAALHLGNALRNITLAAGPMVDWMVRGVDKFAKFVDVQVAAARESGKLAGFFEQTRLTMDRLVHISADLAIALFNIFRPGKKLGDDFLVSLTRNADKFREWTESARGQNAIGEYFRKARTPAYELFNLVRDVAKMLFRLGQGDQVTPLLRITRTELLPAFGELVQSTTKSFGPAFLHAVAEAAKLFARMSGSSGPLVQFTILLGTILRDFNKLLDKFPVLQDVLVTLLAAGGIVKALRLTAAISGVTTLIGLLRRASGVAATTAAVGGASGAAGAGAAGAGAAGGAASKIPVIGVAVLAGYTLLQSVIKTSSEKSDELAQRLRAVRDRAAEMAKAGRPDLIRTLASSMDAWGRSVGATRGQIARFKTGLEDLAQSAERNLGNRVARVVDRAQGHFASFRRLGINDLKGISAATEQNMSFIARVLGRDSEQGRKALSQNFQLAAGAVRQAMKDGRASTREGLAEIRKLMVQSFRAYGFTEREATRLIKAGVTDPTRTPGPFGHGPDARAGGGWIGMPGQAGQDMVPALLGEGEAVLNRHQQGPVEFALRAVFGMGLDDLFARIQRPHYLARGGKVERLAGGGRVSGDTDYLPAMARALNALANAAGVSISVQSGRRTLAEQAALVGQKGLYGPGNPTGAAAPSPNAPHVRGIAADITPGRSVLGGLASRFGLSFPLPGEPWHIQLGGAGAGGGLGAVGGGDISIRPPQTALAGALGSIVQAGLNQAAGAASSAATRLMGSFSGTGENAPPAGGRTSAGGAYNKAALMRLWRRANGNLGDPNLMAAIALAESSGNPNAHNASGATGLWQILGNPFPGNAYDPLTNARMAGSKLRSQGLSAWEVYTTGAYRQYMNRGGFARFAAGGRAKKSPPKPAHATGYSIPTLKRIQAGRSSEVDTLQDTADRLEARYAVQDRAFNLTVEDFLNDDGTLNQRAIQHRIHELQVLQELRNRILEIQVNIRTVVRRMIQSYRTILRKLRAARRSAKRKDRGNYDSEISDYTQALGDSRDKLNELTRTTIPMTRLDVRELGLEIRDVAATRPETPPPDTDTGDTGGDFTPDTGTFDTTTTDTTDTTPEPVQLAPTAEQIAQGVYASLTAFQAARTDLFAGFGSNFITGSGAGGGIAATAGVRYFGAAGADAAYSGGDRSGVGGNQVVQNITMMTPPPDSHAWAKGVMFDLRAGI